MPIHAVDVKRLCSARKSSIWKTSTTLLKSERDLAVAELSAFQNGFSEGEIIYESGAETITYRAMDSTNPPSSNVPQMVIPPANQSPGAAGIPELDPSDPFRMELNLPPSSANPASVPEFSPVYQGEQSGANLNGPESNTASRSVADIVIDSANSRGHDVDGKPGDEGLNLLIQPKAFSGETLLQAGELTVSVIDPAESADQQRIGLWKFLPQETELFFANDNPGSRGILLHLPWDQATPRHGEVVVFVRFKTSDGRRLETSAKIRITPPGAAYSPEDPQVAGWTKRDDRWLNSPAAGASQKRIRAIPASSSGSRIKKPSWRPVR